MLTKGEGGGGSRYGHGTAIEIQPNVIPVRVRDHVVLFGVELDRQAVSRGAEPQGVGVDVGAGRAHDAEGEPWAFALQEGKAGGPRLGHARGQLGSVEESEGGLEEGVACGAHAWLHDLQLGDWGGDPRIAHEHKPVGLYWGFDVLKVEGDLIHCTRIVGEDEREVGRGRGGG